MPPFSDRHTDNFVVLKILNARSKRLNTCSRRSEIFKKLKILNWFLFACWRVCTKLSIWIKFTSYKKIQGNISKIINRTILQTIKNAITNLKRKTLFSPYIDAFSLIFVQQLALFKRNTFLRNISLKNIL